MMVAKWKIGEQVMFEYQPKQYESTVVRSIEAQVLGVQWYEIGVTGKRCPFGVAPEYKLSEMPDKPLKSGDRVQTVDYMQIGDLVIDRHRKGVITSLDDRRGFERECWVAFEGSGFYMIHSDKLERIDTEVKL